MIYCCAQGIAAIEKCIVENFDLDLDKKSSFEYTRLHDLYLLKTILEEDNTSVVRKVDVGTLPNYFSQLYHYWPPLNAKNNVFSISAYQVITEALKKRVENRTDEQNEEDLEECLIVGTKRKLKDIYDEK